MGSLERGNNWYYPVLLFYNQNLFKRTYIYIEKDQILFTSKAQKYASDVQVRMNNERFMVPEILFRPSDIGIQQVNPCLRKSS